MTSNWDGRDLLTICPIAVRLTVLFLDTLSVDVARSVLSSLNQLEL